MADKTRVELRLDAGVYAGLKDLADRAGLSVNQLMQGLSRWAVANGHAGKPYPDAGNVVQTVEEPGMVWFGPDGYSEDNEPVGGGDVVFVLDYTDGNAVRSGGAFYPEPTR